MAADGGWDSPRVSARLTALSAYPVERDNGLQWAAKGVSGVLRGGISWRSGPLELQLRPEVVWSQNADYAVYDTVRAVRDDLATPWWRGLDHPQRHGRESVVWMGPGESSLTLDLGGVEVAAASEQQAWGPALHYPLLLGPSAPPFPHLALSSDGPIDLGRFARLEFRLLWGLLDESGYFDDDTENDRRLLSGLVVSLQPFVLPGFTLGAASLVHTELQEATVGSAFSFFQAPVEPVSGNVEGNGLGALFARWSPPGSGLDAYLEWARDDYGFSARQLLAEPDRASAWTMGIQHVNPLGRRLLRLGFEATRLTGDDPDIFDGAEHPVFYTHHRVRQGHTHRGQLLGAPVGPGSDAQHLRLHLFAPGSLWGLTLERIRWDDDAYVRFKAAEYGRDGHDVELALGLEHGRSLGSVRLDVEGGLHLRQNRIFHNLTGADPDHSWEPNLRVDVQVTWVPPGA